MNSFFKVTTWAASVFLVLFVTASLRSHNTSQVSQLETVSVTLPEVVNAPVPFPSKRPVKTLDLSKNSRVIYLTTEVDERILEQAKRLTSLSQDSLDPIYVIINSPGGSVLDGGIFIGAIKASKAPVYTICTQICASMGAMIHQYGTKRLMVHNSTLMFHPASGGLQGTLEQMNSRLTYISRFVNKMGANTAARSGLTLEQYQALVVSEFWVEADDALARHFADDIVDLNLTAAPSFDLGRVIPNENKKESSVKTVKELIDIKN